MHPFRLFRGKLESPWWINNGVGAAAIGVVLIAASLLVGPSWGCHIPAIYNFGDSNSDTGSVSAAFGRLPPPYGETFFGKPSGRYSDGRLIIDFIGFVSPLGYCCGHLGVAECWQTSIVNGTEVFAASCSDPSKHISWDGAHYTEAANKWVANHIVEGSLSDPPIPLTKSCHSYP